MSLHGRGRKQREEEQDAHVRLTERSLSAHWRGGAGGVVKDQAGWFAGIGSRTGWVDPAGNPLEGLARAGTTRERSR